MAQARTGPIRARLQWVRLPVWSVYGLGGLLVCLGLAMPWLAAWQGLLRFEVKDAPTKSQALRPEMILLPRGSFNMGSDTFDEDEKPVHRVTVDSFLMCQTEVTQAQWRAVMGDNPSDCIYGCEDDAPVQNVSWFDAVRYLNRLSELQGLATCYEFEGEEVTWRECDGYRLPTEAEWEYATRAGTTTAYSFGDDMKLGEYAWFRGNAGEKVHSVARKWQNPWGFHDMHGNVYEWVWDWYGLYSEKPEFNPRGPKTGDRRLLRGGSFAVGDWYLRSADRVRNWPTFRGVSIGFRCVRVSPNLDPLSP